MAIKEKVRQPGDPDYFACSCKQEGKKECDDLLIKVKTLLKSNDSNLLTNVVYSLNIDYNAGITSIASDQWRRISSKTLDRDHETFKEIEPPAFSTEIDCDQVEVGVAATWYAYYKKFGKSRKDRVLPPELLSKAIKATNGELAWKREDLEQVLGKLGDSHIPILGGEVWAVTDENNKISSGRAVMRLSDGRVALGIIPDKNGEDGVYQWSYEQKAPMNILEITESSKKYALEMINKLDPENDVTPEFANSLYYNLTWDI